MLFNSFAFLYFFALVYPFYLCLAHRWQNVLLLGASYVFYGLWDWRFLGLLLITTAVDFASGRLLGAELSPGRRKAVLGVSLAVNLGMLGFFKYWGFFVDSAVAGLSALGFHPWRPVLSVVLPAGISFYTFQSLSYVIDVYRGQTEPSRDPLDFALFVAFFPHLVAGPIMRAGALLPQVRTPRVVTGALLRDGLFLLLVGYFKKCVVADNLAPFVQRMRMPGVLSGGELLVGLYCMAFFLYTDFSGYSDIACGLGKLLGFELPENFRRPFFAQSPADFWRRWHVTLSDWFRDYVFAPLVRLRGKAGRSGPYALACAVVTLVLCGLWHGAAWNFVAFGLYHGVLLALYFAVRPLLRRLWQASRLPRRARRVVANLVFFHVVALAAVPFLIPQPHDWAVLATGLVHGSYDAAARTSLLTLVLFVGPLLALEAVQEARGDPLAPARAAALPRLACFAALFAFILLAGATETHAFVYFQF